MEKLYKKDSKGKVLEWFAQPSNTNDILMSSGELNGQKSISWRRNIKGKNIGKANETTDIQQVNNDIESLYNEKKKKGYKSIKDLKETFGDLYHQLTLETFLLQALPNDNTTAEGNLKPMFCQQYYRDKKDWMAPDGRIYKDRKYYYLQNPHVPKEKGAVKMNFPCIIQGKINGVRTTSQLDNDSIILLSREGTKYNVNHIQQVLLNNKFLFDNNIILDGELYIPNEALQVITSAVKLPNLNSSRIEYHIFDLAISGVPFIERFKLLKELLSKINDPYNCIKLVRAFKVSNDTTVQQMTDTYISEGYEGSVLRAENGLYEFGKRPMTITKLKRLIDEEFKIISVRSQEKRPEFGMFVCQTKDKKQFTINPTMSDVDKLSILINPNNYIGKLITIKFYEYTEDGIPFHIVDNIIRDYE
jgi:DNA ligase-1